MRLFDEDCDLCGDSIPDNDGITVEDMFVHLKCKKLHDAVLNGPCSECGLVHTSKEC